MAAAAIHHHCRSLWLSDLHLGSRGCQAEYLLAFLRSVRTDTLYLVGDIIDLWAMQRQVYWPASHQAVIQQLTEMARSGTRVIYVPGNHDARLRDFAPTQLLGLEMQLQAEHITAAGKRLLVVHGDQFDGAVSCGPLLEWLGDKGYDALLWLNRYYNRLRERLGLGYWSLAGYIKGQVGKAQLAIQRYQQAALLEARKQGYDGIICGHIHVACLKLDDHDITYANTGDWVESCTAIVEHHNGALSLLRVLEGSLDQPVVEPQAEAA